MNIQSPNKIDMHQKVVANRGLHGLIELQEKSGITKGIEWNQDSDMFTVAIPFRQSQIELAKECLTIAREKKLSARIDTVQSKTHQEVSVLLIGTEMQPTTGIYSPYDLSIGLNKEISFVGMLISSYQYMHENKDVKLPNLNLASTLLSGAPIKECHNSPDLVTISNSNIALLYITSEGRASLAIPDTLVKPEEHNTLEDLIKTLAKELGAETMTVKNGSQHVRILQHERSAFNELKAFAQSQNMIFS